MLKYARFYHPTLPEVIVLTLPPFKLSSLADVMRTVGYAPISAGFVQFGPAGNITTHGESVSLNLRPMPDDARRIYLLYVNTPIGTARPAANTTTALPVKSETISDLPPISIESTPRPDWQKDPFYSASVNCRP